MPPDLAHLLHEAAPEPTSPLDPEHLWAAGRRSRRHRRLTLGLAIVATVGLAAAAVGRIDRTDPDRTITATNDIVTYEDPTHGFTVDYPTTWHRAATTLTPDLTDPVEIFSLGTGDLPSGGDACGHLPIAALEAMSPTDTFITVLERLSPAEGAGFPPRPDQLPPPGSKNINEASEVVDCLAERPVFDHWWFAFSDADRGFHVLVAIGTQAPDQTRAETWAILDSLRFDPDPDARIPALEGLTVDQARQELQQIGLQASPNDGDPTESDAVVAAQEPPADEVVSHGDTVGLRTALVTPEICDALRRLPDFSNGAHWDLPLDALAEIANIAGPALHDDIQLVIDHITSGDDTPTPAATRALDRLVIHRRACD